VTGARVLAVGLDPAKLQGWDPEPLQAAIARGQARFDDHGIEADWCLVALNENPEGAIVEALTRNDYVCVVIGGGIRRPEPLLEFFEKVVNLVRLHAPTQPSPSTAAPRIAPTQLCGGCASPAGQVPWPGTSSRAHLLHGDLGPTRPTPYSGRRRGRLRGRGWLGEGCGAGPGRRAGRRGLPDAGRRRAAGTRPRGGPPPV
jgi:hypothetical protein